MARCPSHRKPSASVAWLCQVPDLLVRVAFPKEHILIMLRVTRQAKWFSW